MTDTAQPVIHKGLDGVLVDTTAVSKVMPETNSLTYRGYPVQDLCETCSFEEVAYLLWNGELPNRKQLAAFQKAERAERKLSPRLLRVIAAFPRKGHPMDTIRTAVSFLALEDPETGDNSEAANRRKALRLLAKIPTAVAASLRCRMGKKPVAPRADLSFSENFFRMCFGKVPAKQVVKAFDVSLILYAEHSFNASTFTARVVASTLADLHAATVGGIAALKGPLHGGANEAVMHMLKEIGSPRKAKGWIDDKLEHRALVMGFGHRVYKWGDSRVPTMTKYMKAMADFTGGHKWVEISEILAGEMLAKKTIHPNLDYPAGPAYYMMGFPIDYFTPIFVMSRTTGWSAHVIEQHNANKLIRPLSVYTGSAERAVPPMKARA